MLSNYLKIAFRNLRKNGLYSFINVFGLALGIASCLLILLFVSNELSFDRWNPLAERIVRPVSEIKFGGAEMNMAVVGSVIGPDATKELPEIQQFCRFRQRGTYLVRRDGEAQQNFREEKLLNVDSTFFELFPLKILEGDPRRCLAQPKTLAISRSRAEKYFASPQLALGQTLVLENREKYRVTAVFEDMSEQSHFRADFLLSLVGDEEVASDPVSWGANNNFHTYLLLRQGTDKKVFFAKFEQLVRRKMAVSATNLLGISLEDFEKAGQYVRFPLQNMLDIHLHSDRNIELAPNGSIKYVWIFSCIAFFILLIACINFMNLATARSAGRAREVGVRKVLGSSRGALAGQFLVESLAVSLIAVSLAVVLAAAALPFFREITERQLSMPWTSPTFWFSLVAGAGVVGFLAGSYPAFFLSAFDAVQVLKGKMGLKSGGGSGLRSGLVVFQFAVSTALIISTGLVYRQLSYIQDKKLGFDKSQILILDDAYAAGDKVYNLKNEMLKNPAVKSVTISGFLPVPSNRNDQTFSKLRAFDDKNSVNMQRWRVDSDYLPTLGMELVAGRNFDPAMLTDSNATILNETAARLFGFENPIGQKIYRPDAPGKEGKFSPEDFVERTVIGVVKDFHFASLRENIGALSLELGRSTGLAMFKISGSDAAPVIADLENHWKNMAPGQPFSYRFMDEAFLRTYRAESRIGKIAGIFGLLSVLISCLGLFGLAAFVTEQRTKEIGVRKILGASVAGITSLLAKDFLKLVVIAIFIASPLAYYFMKNWLSDFAYCIDIQWWIFAAAGLAAVGIAFLTVSFQSIKAALANPVKSLRSE